MRYGFLIPETGDSRLARVAIGHQELADGEVPAVFGGSEENSGSGDPKRGSDNHDIMVSNLKRTDLWEKMQKNWLNEPPGTYVTVAEENDGKLTFS